MANQRNLGRRECDCPDYGISTGGVFAGNNQVNVEQSHCFVGMGQFLKASMRYEASFVYLHRLWSVRKECKFIM